MRNRIIELVEKSHSKADVPDIRIGDTIDVHQKLLDGAKERVAVYSGTVISRAGAGNRETVTVRRIVQGEGVERIFPLHSPKIARIEIKKAGKVRRAKLYYLRDRVGKATKIKDDVKRQQILDRTLKASAEAELKAAQDAAAKTKSEGGTSKRAAKKAKAKEEAAKAKK
jgi:large subunit ribosomal protein L19